MIVLVSSATARTNTLPRWITSTGIAIAPALAIGGLAFPLNGQALYTTLYVLLPALLLWMPTTAITLARRGSTPHTATTGLRVTA